MSTTPDKELVELIFDHLCEEQPETIADVRDYEAQRRISIGIHRARSHALVTDGAITAFVTLMFLVAPNFDEQANISRALSDTALPPDERIQKIFSQTSEADWEMAAGNARDWDSLA